MSDFNPPKIINYTRERVRQRDLLHELAERHAGGGDDVAAAIYSSMFVLCEHLEALVRATRDRGES